METTWIAIQTFCRSHEIGPDFVHSISEIGIINIETREEGEFIEERYLSDLEKTVRLYKDLHINSEGIAAVFDLLRQVDTLHHEINLLKNRLEMYEGPEEPT